MLSPHPDVARGHTPPRLLDSLLAPCATARFLVVDASEAVRDYLDLTLRARLDAEVITASSGSDAAGLIGGCDAIVTDLDLPFGSGLYLIDRAHRIDPGICTFVLTAAADDDSGVMAARARGALVFRKSPEGFRSLMHAISRSLVEAERHAALTGC